VEAAANAGMDCFVLTTMHPEEDFAAYENVVGFGKDFNSSALRSL
jgi:beta-phosphoglucomutase